MTATQYQYQYQSALPERIVRLLDALLDGPQTYRALADRIPTNNPAEYIRNARNRMGLVIPLEWIQFTTIDGKKSRYGLYSLTEKDREKIAEFVGM